MRSHLNMTKQNKKKTRKKTSRKWKTQIGAQGGIFKLTGPGPNCCIDNSPTTNRVWEYSEARLTLHTPQDPTHRRSQRVQTPRHTRGLRAPPSPLSWPPAAWSLRGERCSVSADRYLHSPFSRWGLTHAKLGDYTEVIFEEMRSAVGVHICNCSW